MKSTAKAAWVEEIQDRDEQRKLKRQAILRTAAKAFNEVGFHETSLNNLAERLNVSKPTLYYYVKNKDDILFACNQFALEHLREALTAAQNRGETGLERLRLFFSRYAEFVTDDFGICSVRSGDQALTPESKKKTRQTRLELDRAVRGMIEQGIRDGSIGPCDSRFATFALFGAFNWVAHWYKPDGALSPIEISDRLLAFLGQGLLPRKKRASSSASLKRSETSS